MYGRAGDRWNAGTGIDRGGGLDLRLPGHAGAGSDTPPEAHGHEPVLGGLQLGQYFAGASGGGLPLYFILQGDESRDRIGSSNALALRCVSESGGRHAVPVSSGRDSGRFSDTFDGTQSATGRMGAGQVSRRDRE